MKRKNSVTIQGVRPEIWYCVGIAEMVYREAGHECVVTSMTDSHDDRPGSLHLKGLAVDLRTRDLDDAMKQKIAGTLKALLDPKGYDIVLEADHIHAEYDPKTGENWQTLEA